MGQYLIFLDWIRNANVYIYSIIVPHTYDASAPSVNLFLSPRCLDHSQNISPLSFFSFHMLSILEPNHTLR